MYFPTLRRNNDRLNVTPKLLMNIQALAITSMNSASPTAQVQKDPISKRERPRVTMDRKLISIQHGQKTEVQVKSSEPSNLKPREMKVMNLVMM